MPALDQATAVMTLGALAGLNSFTATSGSLKIRLTLNIPTATVAGTEISGSGYTAGGSTIAFSGLAGTTTGAICYNTSSLTWNNTGVASWTIYGLELYDATPTRKAYGIWDDAPLTVGPGSPFVVAAQAIGWAFP